MTCADAGVRIALIHALEESIGPARAAFARLWPQAFVYDLLDTSLAIDRAHAGKLDDSMMERFSILAGYAADHPGKGGRTAGILFTCSAFGPAIEAVKAQLSIPVLRPNEAAFRRALEAGDRLGLVVSFEPSRTSLEHELQMMAAAQNRKVAVVSTVVEGALDALKAGDGARHDELVAAAVSRLHDVDAIVLGQFSLARARNLCAKMSRIIIITTPESAVEALKAEIEGGSSGV